LASFELKYDDHRKAGAGLVQYTAFSLTKKNPLLFSSRPQPGNDRSLGDTPSISAEPSVCPLGGLALKDAVCRQIEHEGTGTQASREYPGIGLGIRRKDR